MNAAVREEKLRKTLADFLDALRVEGVISDQVASDCVRVARASTLAALDHLLQTSGLPVNVLGERWGGFIGASHVSPKRTITDPDLIASLPEAFCSERQCLPLFAFGSTVTTAMADPYDADTIAEIEGFLGRRVSPVFAFPSELAETVSVRSLSAQSLSAMIDELSRSLTASLEDRQAAEGEGGGDLPAAAELVDTLLLWSRKENASDIHIQPTERDIEVRFRIDGMLQFRARLQRALLGAIVNRLKILSKLDITERRRPQDGNLRTRVRDIPLEYRFSSVPTIYGERIVLRSTADTGAKAVVEIDHLGLAPHNEALIREIIRSPNGIFFVTGPTGSGKSTTLFALLQALNAPDVNILTVEDPVERRLPGISQVQVNPAIDVSFGSVLRAFLRQDPDVILIGEVRDLESARIAAEAALTGHLVMSTMHTNSALQAVMRLVDIGVEPFLVAPAIIGVAGQRLVRRLCMQCRQPYTATGEALSAWFENTDGVTVTLYRPTGCEHCNQTGYAGRLAVHEVVLISDEMRSLISREAGIMEIEALAYEEGFRNMRYDALRKALMGLTSLEEVARVVPR